jgi:hypothetical protein
VVLGEYGFMVLVWLRGLREFRTKIAQLPQPFPPHLPRAAKIKPKTVRTLYEGEEKNVFSAIFLSLLAFEAL